VSPTFEVIENFCDNSAAREKTESAVVRNHSNHSMTNYHQQQHQQQQQQQQQHQRHHQTAVHASQSHQTLALRDDGSSALSGLVSALLGGRPSGNRTHEVIVHSPVSVLNGGNSMAKAASMSELVKETSSNPDILS